MSSLDDFLNEMIEGQWLDVEDMPITEFVSYEYWLSRHDLHNDCSMSDCVECVKESGILDSWQELFPQAYHDRYDNAAYMAAYRALIDNDDMSEDEARHHMVMAQDEVIAILQGKERSYFLFNDAAESWILSMVDVD